MMVWATTAAGRTAVPSKNGHARAPKSCEDAIQLGLARAGKTLRNIRGAWIKEQHIHIDQGKVTEYRVNMMITFVLDEAGNT